MFPDGKGCYDHIGGDLGRFLLDRLAAAGVVERTAAKPIALAKGAESVLRGLGIDPAELRATKRTVVATCTDRLRGTEHLGALVGFLVARRLEDLGWTQRRGAEVLLDPPSRLPEAWRPVLEPAKSA